MVYSRVVEGMPIMWESSDGLGNPGCESGWGPYVVAPVMFHCRANIETIDGMKVLRDEVFGTKMGEDFSAWGSQ